MLGRRREEEWSRELGTCGRAIEDCPETSISHILPFPETHLLQIDHRSHHCLSLSFYFSNSQIPICSISLFLFLFLFLFLLKSPRIATKMSIPFLLSHLLNYITSPMAMDSQNSPSFFQLPLFSVFPFSSSKRSSLQTLNSNQSPLFIAFSLFHSPFQLFFPLAFYSILNPLFSCGIFPQRADFQTYRSLFISRIKPIFTIPLFNTFSFLFWHLFALHHLLLFSSSRYYFSAFFFFWVSLSFFLSSMHPCFTDSMVLV